METSIIKVSGNFKQSAKFSDIQVQGLRNWSFYSENASIYKNQIIVGIKAIWGYQVEYLENGNLAYKDFASINKAREFFKSVA